MEGKKSRKALDTVFFDNALFGVPDSDISQDKILEFLK